MLDSRVLEGATGNTTPKTIDQRFDEVQQGFLDQRDYTTFCFDKLRQEIRQSEGRLARRLDRHEELIGEVLREVRTLKPK